MNKFEAGKYLNVAGNLGAMSQALTMNPPISLSQTNLQNVQRQLSERAAECRELGLPVSARQFELAVENLADLPQGAVLSIQVSTMIVDLQNAMAAEMDTHLFMHIFPDRQQFYEQKELFGPSVNSNFGSAKKDIKAAGSCYAVDRNTACVMHLMRVLEVGLNTLAKELNVDFARRNWENVINDIEAEIKEINGPTWGGDWKQKQQFYSGAAKDFRYFKDAWRNHAMHYHEHYDPSEAKTILDHVKTFMEQLADGGLKE
jgi:hypothetical protein